MKKLFYIFIIGLFTFCNVTGETEIETNAVQSVADFYGGICYKSKGFNSKNGITTTYYGLKMTESDLIEKYANKIEMPASNIAYLFYSKLGIEKSNYDEIHVMIILSDGIERKFIYSTDKLELVTQRMDVVNKIVKLLTIKNYDGLKGLLNNELVKFDKDELISNIRKYELQFGEIKHHVLFGFSTLERGVGREILHVSLILQREVQGSEFFVEIDLNSESEEIFLLNYKL